MKKTAVIIALALLTVVGGYVSVGAYKSSHDQKGQEMALSVMAAVEDVKRKKDSYPTRFDAAPSTVWGILPGPEVTYHYNGSKCFIHYDQWPLGPHHVLDCGTKEWSFED